ncbi:CDP-alcohol phosphatidyltransferase family protein [Acidithiobacillus sp.]
MKRLQHLPNMITLLRMAFVPLLILVLKDHHYIEALWVFMIAGISDGLDDPLADKILLVSAYVMLALLALVPFWLVLVVTFRDALIVGGYLVYTSLYGPVSMRPSRVSKFNTFTQILLVVFLLTERAFGFHVAHIQAALVFMVLVTTIASGGHYLWTWGIVREVEAGRAGRD